MFMQRIPQSTRIKLLFWTERLKVHNTVLISNSILIESVEHQTYSAFMKIIQKITQGFGHYKVA